MQVKVSVERLKRKYAERKRGQRDALLHLVDNKRNIQRSTRRFKCKSQNPN